MSDKCVILISSVSGNQITEVHQRKLYDLFAAKNVKYETLDGSVDTNKDQRNHYFGISGVRKYPQVFINERYIGDWEHIEGLNEMEQFGSTFASVIGQ